MPKYLLEVNYTLQGVQALLEKGGSARKSAAQSAAKSAGGKLESFHFAFGATDVYAIVDMPNEQAAAAMALTVTAGGGATVRTVALLTPADIDAAADMKISYRPPGS